MKPASPPPAPGLPGRPGLPRGWAAGGGAAGLRLCLGSRTSGVLAPQFPPLHSGRLEGAPTAREGQRFGTGAGTASGITVEPRRKGGNVCGAGRAGVTVAAVRSCEVPHSAGPGPRPEDPGPSGGVTCGVGGGVQEAQRAHAGRGGHGAKGRRTGLGSSAAPASPGAAGSVRPEAPLPGIRIGIGIERPRWQEGAPPAGHRWGRSLSEPPRASRSPEPGRGRRSAGSTLVTGRTSQERGAAPTPRLWVRSAARVPGDRPPPRTPGPSSAGARAAQRAEQKPVSGPAVAPPRPVGDGGSAQGPPWTPRPGPPPRSSPPPVEAARAGVGQGPRRRPGARRRPPRLRVRPAIKAEFLPR